MSPLSPANEKFQEENEPLPEVLSMLTVSDVPE
jgi:hypothetical protein